jgi:hypothetical protein
MNLDTADLKDAKALLDDLSTQPTNAVRQVPGR